MIYINDLSFHYPFGDFSLNISNLNIEKNEKVAIIGASGCGKTTFLQLLAGIKVPTKGTIVIDSFQLEKLNDQARRQFRIQKVGIIFQDFELIDYLNVLDNIIYCFRLNPILKLTQEVKDKAYELAKKMNIQDKLKRSISQLSQGEKQRVAICRALLTEPKILLADEATANLDPNNKQKILEILFSYLEESSSILIAVTHDHELLKQFDKVIDLQQFYKGLEKC